MAIILIAHANSKQQLDQAHAAIIKASSLELTSGLVDLPEGISARLGEGTPKEFYENYLWHERIEVAGGDAYKSRSFYQEDPPSTIRQIYTTDPAHPLMHCQAEGQTWRKPHKYVDGAIIGIHFKEDEPVAVHLMSNLNQKEFCKKFCIFLSDGSILESDDWWTVVGTDVD